MEGYYRVRVYLVGQVWAGLLLVVLVGVDSLFEQDSLVVLVGVDSLFEESSLLVFLVDMIEHIWMDFWWWAFEGYGLGL